MNRFLSLLLGYFVFFIMFLGLTFLFHEFWNWFQGDSLVRNAVIATITIMLVDLGRSLYKKYILKS